MGQSILRFKLKTIQAFQEKYPTSHIGGSFGLFLLGYDLKRNLDDSDLDLICPFFDKKNHLIDNDEIEEASDANDFDFKYRRWFGRLYVKYDISINETQDFQVIERNGQKYNVSLFENIIKFKREYADKGVFKHKADIIAIETGVRPLEKFDYIFSFDLTY